MWIRWDFLFRLLLKVQAWQRAEVCAAWSWAYWVICRGSSQSTRLLLCRICRWMQSSAKLNQSGRSSSNWFVFFTLQGNKIYFRSWIFLQFWHSDSHLSNKSACKNKHVWWLIIFVGFDTKICVSSSAADHQWWHWIDTEATRLWCVWNLKGLLGPRLYSVCLIEFKRFVFLVIL